MRFSLFSVSEVVARTASGRGGDAWQTPSAETDLDLGA